MNRRQIANENTRINRRFESKYFPLVLSSLNKVKADLIDFVRISGAEVASHRLNTQLVINGVAPTVQGLYKEVGLTHARRQYRRFPTPEQKAIPGLGFSELWTRNIQDVLNEFLTSKILFSASETTKNLLLKILQEGIREGWGVDRMVQELTEFEGLKFQAERIVRTEVTRASNIGTMEAGKSFRFEQQKEWISILDMRVRGRDLDDHSDHLHLNGQRVDFEQPFQDTRNRDLLNYPGDPTGKKESTINCRCTMALIAKRDERGRLIPKQSRITIDRNFSRQMQTITI